MYVPDKDPFVSGRPDPAVSKFSPQATYEDKVVRHINCEIALGIYRADYAWQMPWLVSDTFGTAVTLTITAEQQGALNAGASLVTPLRNVITSFPAAEGGNVTSPQSFSLGIGVTGSTNATRTETIQWTQRNSDLLRYYLNAKNDCSEFHDGPMLRSDLKIGDFIYDKAQLVAQNNITATTSVPKAFWKKYGRDISRAPLFNTFTGEINFLGAIGGGVNPSWKLVAVNANTASNLLAAESTYTNDVIVTIGGLKDKTFPYQLDTAGADQHQSHVAANAIAVSISSQSHQ